MSASRSIALFIFGEITVSTPDGVTRGLHNPFTLYEGIWGAIFSILPVGRKPLIPRGINIKPTHQIWDTITDALQHMRLMVFFPMSQVAYVELSK